MFQSKKPTQYRKRALPGDPRMQLRLSPELKRDLEHSAKRNCRTITDEINARLIATFQHEEDFMVSDRLERLIFCKKLAYTGKEK